LAPIPSKDGESKIVGLTGTSLSFLEKKSLTYVPGVRNVAMQIPFFLLSFSKHVDSIIVLNDASTDNTADIVVDLAPFFKVEVGSDDE